MAAITFPRAIPDDFRIVSAPFMLAPQVETDPQRSGRVVAADLGPAIWFAEYRSSPLLMDRLGTVRAWFDTLSNIQFFLGFDYHRQYPYAYRRTHFAGLLVGGNPFTGACQLKSVDNDVVRLTLKLLPVGFVLTPGDYLSFVYGSDSRALHRVSAGGVADGSGELLIEVRPHVRVGWTADAPVNLYRAAANMLVLPKSYDETVERGIGAVSFRARQSL